MKDPLAEIRKRDELDGNVWPFKVALIIILLVSVIVLNALDKDTAKAVVVYWAFGMTAFLAFIAVLDIRNSKEMKRWKREQENG